MGEKALAEVDLLSKGKGVVEVEDEMAGSVTAEAEKGAKEDNDVEAMGGAETAVEAELLSENEALFAHNSEAEEKSELEQGGSGGEAAAVGDKDADKAAGAAADETADEDKDDQQPEFEEGI